jgi:hypothetical protein
MLTMVRVQPVHFFLGRAMFSEFWSHFLYPPHGTGWVIILGLCIGIVIIIVVLAWLAANYNFSCCNSDANPDALHGSVEKRRRPRTAHGSLVWWRRLAHLLMIRVPFMN